MNKIEAVVRHLWESHALSLLAIAVALGACQVPPDTLSVVATETPNSRPLETVTPYPTVVLPTETPSPTPTIMPTLESPISQTEVLSVTTDNALSLGKPGFPWGHTDPNMGGYMLAPQIGVDAAGNQAINFSIQPMDDSHFNPDVLHEVDNSNGIHWFGEAIAFPFDTQGFDSQTLTADVLLNNPDVDNAWYAIWLMPDWDKMAALGVRPEEIARIRVARTEIDALEGVWGYLNGRGLRENTTMISDHDGPQDPPETFPWENLNPLLMNLDLPAEQNAQRFTGPNDPLRIKALINYQLGTVEVRVNGVRFYQSPHHGTDRFRVQTQNGDWINIPWTVVVNAAAGGDVWPGKPVSHDPSDNSPKRVLSVESLVILAP